MSGMKHLRRRCSRIVASSSTEHAIGADAVEFGAKSRPRARAALQQVLRVHLKNLERNLIHINRGAQVPSRNVWPSSRP